MGYAKPSNRWSDRSTPIRCCSIGQMFDRRHCIRLRGGWDYLARNWPLSEMLNRDTVTARGRTAKPSIEELS